MRILILLLLSLMIPNELYWLIGTVRIEIYRIVLIVSFIILIKNYRLFALGVIEYLLLFFCFWASLSFIVKNGFSGIQPSAMLFLEVFVCFGIGRLATEFEFYKIRKFIIVISLVLIFFIPFSIYEANTGYRVFHIFAAELNDVPVMEKLKDAYIRMGIHRSSSVFAHPILYSVTAVALYPLILRYSKGLYKFVFSSGVITALIVAVTSAGYLMLLTQIGLYILEKINNYFKGFKKYSLLTILGVLTLIQLFSQRGALIFIINHATLSSHTAYYRYLQWTYAWDDVKRNPLLGLGNSVDWTRPWWMQSSVDSYWLSSFLKSGLVATYILLAAWLVIIYRLFSYYSKTGNRDVMVFCFSIISLFLGSQTVELFDRAHPIAYLILGMGVGVYNYSLKNAELVK